MNKGLHWQTIVWSIKVRRKIYHRQCKGSTAFTCNAGRFKIKVLDIPLMPHKDRALPEGQPALNALRKFSC